MPTRIGCAICCVIFSTATAASPVTVAAPGSGVELGLGWDSIRGKPLPSVCVAFSAVQERGQNTRLHMTEVSDNSEVMDRLNISAAASVSSILGSGSAKVSFAKNVKVGGSSTSMMIVATVVNGPLFAAPSRWTPGTKTPSDSNESTQHRITLLPWAKALLAKDQGGDKFRALCGDSFVSAIHGGAELIALYTFKAASREESEQFEASLKATFTAGQFNSEASKQAGSAMQTRDVEVQFTQLGGAGGAIPTSPEGFVNKLETVAKEAVDAPGYHSVELTPYAALGTAIRPVADDPWLDYLSDVYWLFSTMDRELDEVRHHAGDYDYHTADTDLDGFQDEIRCVRRLLYTALHANRTASGFDETKFACVPGPARLHETVSNQDLKDLVDRLQARYGSVPNAVRLRMPLPLRAVAGAQSVADYEKAALNWYVRRPSERMCALDPTDNECLTNEEIEKLKPTARQTLAGDYFIGNFVANVQTGECWDFTSGTPPFDVRLAPCDSRSKTQPQFRYTEINSKPHFLLPTPVGNPNAICMSGETVTEKPDYKVRHVRAAYAPICAGRYTWTLSPDGAMKWGRGETPVCAEAVPRVGAPSRLQLKTCDVDNAYQRWASYTPQEMRARAP